MRTAVLSLLGPRDSYYEDSALTVKSVVFYVWGQRYSLWGQRNSLGGRWFLHFGQGSLTVRAGYSHGGDSGTLTVGTVVVHCEVTLTVETVVFHCEDSDISLWGLGGYCEERSVVPQPGLAGPSWYRALSLASPGPTGTVAHRGPGTKPALC